MQTASQKNKTCPSGRRALSRAMSPLDELGMTLIEIIVALVIVAIIFAALAQQFRPAQSSWASKQTHTEIFQNARAMMDHITFNLTKARRITAVSGPNETPGYIEFIDNDGNTLRYDVAANDYVRFGPVGDLADLAGPVSRLQFNCYDMYDLFTAITEADAIRVVKIQATFPKAGPLCRDKTFSTCAYLRTNVKLGGGWNITMGTALEYNISNGQTPVLCRMDSLRHLCAFTGPDTQGCAVLFTANLGARTVSKGVTFPFEPVMCLTPDLVKIDFEHYLCAYTGPDSDGWAVVLEADAATGAISAKTPFEFSSVSEALSPALCRIDPTHYLCAYTAQNGWGVVAVLTVNPASWTITKKSIFVYDNLQSLFPRLSRIDATHYLCVYEGQGSVGVAVVLVIDTETWAVSKGPSFIYDGNRGKFPRLSRIDDTHHLCAYSGKAFRGLAAVLIVNPGTWTVSRGPAFTYYDQPRARYPALHRISNNYHLCAYSQGGFNGGAVVLNVDPGTWTITRSNPVIFDVTKARCPFLSQINTVNYLCAYEGVNSDGWVVILNTQPPVAP